MNESGYGKDSSSRETSSLAEVNRIRLSLLLKNSLYSLFSLATPLIVSVVTIPILIERLGAEKFGVLALTWIFIGYFSLFDLGLGRSTAKYVAEYLAQNKVDKLPQLIWTSWFTLICLGLIASLILFLLIPWLIQSALKIPPDLVKEARNTLVWIAFSIPFVIFVSGTRAVLEASQHFRMLTWITTPASILTFLIPVLALPFTRRLDLIVLLLLLNRMVFVFIYYRACCRVVPGLDQFHWPDRTLVKRLLQFGGWLTVSSVIAPFMSYMDRFLIGFFFPLTAVTYYVTPSEILQRLRLIPNSLMLVMFPAFSSLHATNGQESAALFHRTSRLLFLLMLPLGIILIVFARDILTIWVSADFAAESATVMKILTVGLLINTLAQVAFSWIQSAGYAHITAYFHLLELPFYLGLVWFLADAWGIEGVALAWTIRVGIDALLLLGFAYLMLDRHKQHFTYLLALLGVSVGFGSIVSWAIQLVSHLAGRVAVATFFNLLYAMVIWRYFLLADEKKGLKAAIDKLVGRV